MWRLSFFLLASGFGVRIQGFGASSRLTTAVVGVRIATPVRLGVVADLPRRGLATMNFSPMRGGCMQGTAGRSVRRRCRRTVRAAVTHAACACGASATAIRAPTVR